MSLIIKGLDMPKYLNKPLRLEIHADGHVWIDHGADYEYIDDVAVQIPKDHGRLTDNKEILARAEQEVDGLVMSAEHLPMVIEWILDKCDTILEAEE